MTLRLAPAKDVLDKMDELMAASRAIRQAYRRGEITEAEALAALERISR